MSRANHSPYASPESAQAGRELDKTRHEAKRALELLRKTDTREARQAFQAANDRARVAYETFKRLAYGGEE